MKEPIRGLTPILPLDSPIASTSKLTNNNNNNNNSANVGNNDLRWRGFAAGVFSGATKLIVGRKFSFFLLPFLTSLVCYDMIRLGVTSIRSK